MNLKINNNNKIPCFIKTFSQWESGGLDTRVLNIWGWQKFSPCLGKCEGHLYACLSIAVILDPRLLLP